MGKRILVVDDDRQLTSFLERFLRKQGYHVTTAFTAAQMTQMTDHHDFDLIVLDIGLPDGDGFEITREIRKSSQLPIIVLTARDEVFDRVIGLELGADDYVTKPFEPRELLARIKSVLRRTQTPTTEAPTEEKHRDFAGFRMDLGARAVHRLSDAVPVALTSTEYALLLALTEAPGKVLSRPDILDALYGNSATVTDRAIDAHVARLRRKLHEMGGDTALIRTIHGVGDTLAATIEVG